MSISSRKLLEDLSSNKITTRFHGVHIDTILSELTELIVTKTPALLIIENTYVDSNNNQVIVEVTTKSDKKLLKLYKRYLAKCLEDLDITTIRRTRIINHNHYCTSRQYFVCALRAIIGAYISLYLTKEMVSDILFGRLRHNLLEKRLVSSNTIQTGLADYALLTTTGFFISLVNSFIGGGLLLLGLFGIISSLSGFVYNALTIFTVDKDLPNISDYEFELLKKSLLYRIQTWKGFSRIANRYFIEYKPSRHSCFSI